MHNKRPNLLPPASAWIPINDVVMGGRSGCQYLPTADNGGCFTGHVSLENNGGFASVRAPLSLEPPAANSVLSLSVIGDGKRYALRFRLDHNRDGITYSAAFATRRGTGTTDGLLADAEHHRFTISDFSAVWRGKPVSDAPPFRWDGVAQIGLMISDRQAGDFRLALIALGWGDPPGTA